MTAALDSAAESDADNPDVESAPDWQPAGWWSRAGAFGIDVLAGAGVAAAALMTGWSAPPQSWLWWICMVVAAVVVVAIAANRWLLPASTGWTLGRSVFGIEVVGRDGSPVATPRLAVRDLAHLLDTAPVFLGWLWPLIDRRGRTFADIAVGTEVRTKQGAPAGSDALAVRVLAAAAALSVLAAALGYAVVYRHQRAVDTAREQIAERGPKIVVDVLSYTANTVTDDFTKAQSLVTDAYRPELANQQDAVRKNPLDNQYWVSNSAILSAEPNRATMLLLLQGQRGPQPNPRFVTASVRADFEKTGRDDWKLSNLTVLSAPKSAEEPPKPEPPKPEAPKPEAPKPEPPKPEAPKPEASKPEAPEPGGGGR